MDIISTFNSSFTINRLSEEQYQAAKDAGEISGYHEFEFYLTEGDSGGGGSPQDISELSGKVDSLSTDLNATKTDLQSTKTNVSGIDTRLQIVEGQMGMLVKGYIQCFIAPAAQYFIDNGFTAHTDGDGRTYYTKEGAEYYYGDGHFYPGNDDNMESQYDEFGKNPYKYPLFTLNAAMEFLRRFRSNGITVYQVVTQYGDYEYGSTMMGIKISDAVAGSKLEIGAYPTLQKRQDLRCVSNPGCLFDGTFQDSDIVKVRFIWDDDNYSEYTDWCGTFQCIQSDTMFQNCGFYLRRKRSSASYEQLGSLTYGATCIESGNVRFYSCLFRNITLTDNSTNDIASSMLINIMVPEGQDYQSDPEYKLDNIGSWQIPNIFIDDPAPDGTSKYTQRCFIESNDGSKSSYQFYGYTAFLSTRHYPICTTNASNVITFTPEFFQILKISVVGTDASDSIGLPFSVSNMAMLRYTRGGTPTTATNQTWDQVLRIDLHYDNRPTWLTDDPKCITTSTVNGWNKETGVYDSARWLLESSRVYYNGSPLGS